ncbi:aminotransferase class III-fold pyridoxal phosphate-dependent enzyme [Marinilabiliaceae bacterium JC017]|nr:aminotransferase class III-fold pyridoxal phosphate-dependent enzyme [Marinilabiliaceae bacterium JC017]
MKLFDVYSLFDVTPVKAKDCYVWDDKGNKYLDLYGGHAVISIGHSHPHYIASLSEQLQRIGFYSNSVKNPLQEELATKLGQLSEMDDYSLFLCNSGAEANENALKLASFHTGRKKVVAFEKAFHGRTSAAVAATDNPKIVSPLNTGHDVVFLPMNDTRKVSEVLAGNDVAAVIIEGIQGIGGIHIPEPGFLRDLAFLCQKHNTVLILDEIQSGYGRSGMFFAFQHAGIHPDIVTMAKGMGNGFPVGGLLIHPDIKASKGMLGTTFGGNYLACAASIAVLDVINDENLIANTRATGEYLLNNLKKSIKTAQVRGIGLMIGVEFSENIALLRKHLLEKKYIFTGVSGINTVRLLPPLTLTKAHADVFMQAVQELVDST